MDAPLRFRDLANLAGALTLARIPLAFGTAFVMHDHALFFGVLLLAGLTDVLDGPVARWRGTASRAGAVADGWADKIFLINYAWSMQMTGYIDPIHMWVWFIREIIQGAFVPLVALDYARARKPHPQPVFAGKIATWAIGVGMIAALLGFTGVRDLATVVAGITGLYAALVYLFRDRPWQRFGRDKNGRSIEPLPPGGLELD